MEDEADGAASIAGALDGPAAIAEELVGRYGELNWLTDGTVGLAATTELAERTGELDDS